MWNEIYEYWKNDLGFEFLRKIPRSKLSSIVFFFLQIIFIIAYTYFSILFNNFQKGSETKNASPEVNVAINKRHELLRNRGWWSFGTMLLYVCFWKWRGHIIGAEGKRRRDRHVKRAHTHRDLDFFACRTKQRFIQNKEGRKKKKGMKKKKR